VGDDVFLIARNPEEDSKLPYVLRLPIEGGLVLKARDTCPLGQDLLPRLRRGMARGSLHRRRDPSLMV
jgi:hypothetical protein